MKRLLTWKILIAALLLASTMIYLNANVMQAIPAQISPERFGVHAFSKKLDPSTIKKARALKASVYAKQVIPDYVTPEQFGANGFDTIADTEAMQKAFNEGGTVQLKDDATYIIDEELVARKSITIKASEKKATIIQQNVHASLLHFRNPAKLTTYATTVINKGKNSIVVNDTTNISPGDIIELKSNKLWHWDHRNKLTKGEIHTVDKVVGNNVYLTSKTDDYYAVGNGETVTVRIYPRKTISIQNINFTYPTATAVTMIKIDPTVGSTFSRLSISNAKKAGLIVTKSLNTKIDNSYFSLGTTKDIKSGYGYQDYGSRGTIISNSTFKNIRRGVDFSGDIPSRYGKVVDSRAYGSVKGTLASGDSGFGTHSTAEYITFENNYVENFTYNFVSRGNHITFKNNKATGTSKAFFHTNHGDNIHLVNNTYVSTNGSILDYFILKSNSFNGTVSASGNKGVYRTYTNR